MDEVFHRPQYAKDLASALLRPSPLDAGYRSGVFLSGIRRIGKTTFLRQDFIPALQAAGALPIYVDLWADKLRNPSVLVNEVVRKTIREMESPESKIWAQLKRVKGVALELTGGFKFGVDLESLGSPGSPTLADAFAELVRLTQTDVVLIVDEVQHAVGSEDGMNLLHALKAARDRVNTDPDMPGKFLFVGTGSHKALVTDMATRRSHPFAGATTASFEVLGEDFVVWRLNQIKASGAKVVLPSVRATLEGFRIMGSRPEELNAALRELQKQVDQHDVNTLLVDRLFLSISMTLASAAAAVEVSAIEGFGKLGEAVFSRVAHGKALFSAEALANYAEKTGVHIDVPQVQNTADKMIAANLVMRIGHGQYGAADPFVREAWIAHENMGGIIAPQSYDDGEPPPFHAHRGG